MRVPSDAGGKGIGCPIGASPESRSGSRR